MEELPSISQESPQVFPSLTCPNCNVMMERKLLLVHIDQAHPKSRAKVLCPHEDCTKILQRGMLPKHLREDHPMTVDLPLQDGFITITRDEQLHHFKCLAPGCKSYQQSSNKLMAHWKEQKNYHNHRGLACRNFSPSLVTLTAPLLDQAQSIPQMPLSQDQCEGLILASAHPSQAGPSHGSQSNHGSQPNNSSQPNHGSQSTSVRPSQEVLVPPSTPIPRPPEVRDGTPRPGGSDWTRIITEDPELICCDAAYHPRSQMLICKICRSGVTPRQFPYHVFHHQPNLKPTFVKSLLTIIQKKFVLHLPPPSFHDHLVEDEEEEPYEPVLTKSYLGYKFPPSDEQTMILT